MNLLAQNPKYHVTPTNDLIDLISKVRDSWMHMSAFKAQGLQNIESRIVTLLNAMFYGFYKNELDANRIVFDKSRGWPAYIELLEIIFQQKVKIIITIRDLKDVLASFEQIHRKSVMTRHAMPTEELLVSSQTIEGRVSNLLNPGSVVGVAINRITDAMDRGLHDRLIFVPYKRLVGDTQKLMNEVEIKLGLEPYQYNPKNVEQVTKEDDTVYGMELHTIRNAIDNKASTWEDFFTKDLATKIDSSYPRLQLLSLL